MDGGLPTPPMEATHNIKSTAGSRRNTSSSTKSVKSIHRQPKRHISHSPVHDHAPLSPHSAGSDRHKRVWKACERCRMKKTKCDGEFPCKRCKADGLVCTAGTRKKTEYKQLPRGYAEVLENTQFALIATVHKLYAMLRQGQQWDLGEPELNERGQPVIHDIATKLGCIRPNADADLPPHSVFPEDEAGLSKLAAELEVHQREREDQQQQQHGSELNQMDMDYSQSHSPEIKSEPTDSNSTCNRTERASSSDLDHSDFEQDYRKVLMSSGRNHNNNLQTLSPQSFTSSYHDFDAPGPGGPASGGSSMTRPDMAMFPVQSPSGGEFPSWNMGRPASMEMPMPIPPPPQQHFMSPMMDINLAEMMLSQGLVESEFGTLKPHIVSCPNPEVMLGVGDPMIYSGYGMESLRP